MCNLAARVSVQSNHDAEINIYSYTGAQAQMAYTNNTSTVIYPTLYRYT